MKLILVPILATLASTASATGVVLTFDASRCGTGPYHLTGTGMVQPYNDLLLNGWTVVTTPLLSDAVLNGVDIFVAGSLTVGTTLAPSEATALQAWVAAGGGLLYIGEGESWAPSNAQFGALVNGPQHGGQYQFFDVVELIVAPSHPLIHGPGGTVVTLAGFNLPGYWINPSPSTTVVTTNPDGSAALVAVTYGTGRAVLLNDVNYFSYPPTYTADHAKLWRNTIDWLAGSGTPVTGFCAGDGTAAPCPCGNLGTGGAGCASSAGPNANLTGNGNASISNDTLSIAGSGMPNSSALYFQGTTRLANGQGISFGDGLRCVGGAIVRLGTSFNSAGASAYPQPGDQPISIRGACSAGAVRMYQVWYRNAAPFCTPWTFNMTNGIEVTWVQ